MVKDERNTYTIHQDPNLGEVKIADEELRSLQLWQPQR